MNTSYAQYDYYILHEEYKTIESGPFHKRDKSLENDKIKSYSSIMYGLKVKVRNHSVEIWKVILEDNAECKALRKLGKNRHVKIKFPMEKHPKLIRGFPYNPDLALTFIFNRKRTNENFKQDKEKYNVSWEMIPNTNSWKLHYYIDEKRTWMITSGRGLIDLTEKKRQGKTL